jgi:hypothetical protein
MTRHQIPVWLLCYFITLPMIAIFVGSTTFGNELFSYKAKVSSSQSKTL